MILLAAIAIGAAAGTSLLHPRPLERVWLGLVVSLVAALVNGGVGVVTGWAPSPLDHFAGRCATSAHRRVEFRGCGARCGIGATDGLVTL